MVVIGPLRGSGSARGGEDGNEIADGGGGDSGGAVWRGSAQGLLIQSPLALALCM